MNLLDRLRSLRPARLDRAGVGAALLGIASLLPGCDYVLVARAETAARPWDGLLDDLRKALLRLAPTLSGSADAPEKGARPRAGRDDSDG
jgi:hypothetical protein